MSRLRRLLDVLFAYALIGLLLAVAVHLARVPDGPGISGPARIVDGDTLEIGGTRIRLLGIDAPELAQSCEAPTGPISCGRDARGALQALVGPDIACQGHRHDLYGR